MKCEKYGIALVLIFSGLVQAQFSLYLEHQIPISSGQVAALEFSQDGRFLAVGLGRGGIHLWDIEAGREVHILKEHRGSVNCLVFDSRGQRLYSGGRDGKIMCWDLFSGNAELTLKDFRSYIQCVALSPDDRLIAAVGKKRDVFLWEIPAGKLKGKLSSGHRKDVIAAAFNASGDQLLTVGLDRQMIVWNPLSMQLIRKTAIESRTMSGSGIDIKSAGFSFDRHFVGVGIQEHVLAKGGRGMIFKYNMSFFDWKTGAEIETLTGNRKDVEFFTISPDKQFVVADNSTLQTHQISFWNIQKGVVESNYPIDGKITMGALSQDGRWLAVAFQDAQTSSRSHVYVWKLSGIDGYARFDTGQPVRTAEASGFGASMKLTTPEEPLIGFGQRRRLAVLTFDSPGLEEDVARTASYLLEGKLGNSPLVELVERNQIDQVLSELRYQQTGLTASNAAEVGRHLNAEYILIGSLNKLGNLLIVTVKLVNVQTAQIEGTREVQASNATIESISDMISLLAPTIARY